MESLDALNFWVILKTLVQHAPLWSIVLFLIHRWLKRSDKSAHRQEKRLEHIEDQLDEMRQMIFLLPSYESRIALIEQHQKQIEEDLRSLRIKRIPFGQ